MTGAARFVVVAAAAAAAFIGLVSLGAWQIERRAWKHALIERVEQRIHAPPAPPPAHSEWPQVNAARDEYRRVRVTGALLHEHEALVQATTALGGGFWVLTPLRQADGTIVFVNRGFVPPERRVRKAHAGDASNHAVTIVGLLRLGEPGGGFLRANDPAHDRWFSRDVAAIALSRGLSNVAPYFVDAERSPDAPADAPIGGLTVTTFSDSHLGYAITWFTLAAMVAAAFVLFVRTERARS